MGVRVRRKKKSKAVAIWLCIIELVPHQVRVHLEEPTTFDAMSTPALSGSMVLFVSAGHAEGSGGRSPNCLWNKKKKKKKGADLLLNWPH